MLKRILTGIILVTYLSVYPAVILCDLHCALNSKTESSGNINSGQIAENHVHVHVHVHVNDQQHNHSNLHHHSDHQQEQVNPPAEPEQSSFPFHSEHASGHGYSFCLSAQSVVSIGISAIAPEIAAVFDTVYLVYNPVRKNVPDITYSNNYGRAPPV